MLLGISKSVLEQSGLLITYKAHYDDISAVVNCPADTLLYIRICSLAVVIEDSYIENVCAGSCILENGHHIVTVIGVDSVIVNK